MVVKKTNAAHAPKSAKESPTAFDEQDFLTSKNGCVWATYDVRQAEIIQNTLLAQDIHSEISRCTVKEKELILINVTNQTDKNDAIDFIWRSKSGLQLKPDWRYPEGEINKSFERWLGGN